MRYTLLGLSVACFLISPRPVSSELIQRTESLLARWEGGLWFCKDSIDFSSQSIVACSNAAADFAFHEHEDPGAGYFVYLPNGASILQVDTPFEDITLAPLGEFHIPPGEILLPGNTYVLKTSDGLYAKLVVRAVDTPYCCGLTAEYVVQTDGTRALAPGVATEPTTWGRVKALYR